MTLTTDEKIRRVDMFGTEGQRITYEIGAAWERLQAYKYYTHVDAWDEGIIAQLEEGIDRLYNQFNANLQAVKHD